MSFQQAAGAYVRGPSAETLTDLQYWIQVDATYDPAVEFRSTVGPMLDGADYRRAISFLQTPGLFLSPSAHTLLSRAYLAVGDETRALQHRDLAAISFVAIRDSGDGTSASPWRVLRISDQHDALALCGMRSIEQVSIGSGASLVDVHTCDDGSRAHFALADTKEHQGAVR